MRGLLVAALAAAAAGCAGPSALGPQWPADSPRVIELEATPFYPQAEFQCGPAALATVLGATGRPVSPAALAAEIYVPDRRGSLQPEIVAAARRRGLLVYPIRPELGDLVAQLTAGQPVLVLQNLGIRSLPVWHYAVVVGADATTDVVVLRSGTERRRREPARDFLRRWDLAGRWGVITLQPGGLPADPDWPAYLRAAADLEAAGHPAAAGAAYAAALDADPGLGAGRLGLANVRYAEGRLDEAAATLEPLAADPVFGAAALNNLANLRLEQGCPAAAAAALARAEAHAAAPGYESALADTRARLEQARRESDGSGCP